jgi:5-methylcytosine-specific restriction enzyme subunit McrC
LNEVSKSDHYIGLIPVANVWLLMLYASDYYRYFGHKLSSLEEMPDKIPDIIGRMLCQSAGMKIRKNLTGNYEERNEDISRLRGRIDLLRTIEKSLFEKGKIACTFFELTTNTPRNRFVKAALDKLSRIVKSAELSRQCMLYSTLMFRQGVVGEKPHYGEISREVYGRHDCEDRQLVLLAKLAFDLALPSEVEGNCYLQSPSRDQKFMRKLFEKGVAGFYKHSLSRSTFHVRSGRKIDWQISDQSSGISDILPSMETDIEIETKDHHIVIDTKFNSILTKGRYREKSLRSGYIYQLYAYLRSQEQPEKPKSLNSIGILLHPSIGENVDENVVIQNHLIRFCTVDLSVGGGAIINRLNEIILSSISFK